MPLVPLKFKAGIVKDITEYASGKVGFYTDGNLVRFRNGYPTKIGGWSKVSTSALVGAARGIITWFSLDGDQYTITGTNKKLYVYQNQAWYDITPIRESGASITNFTTTSGSTTVTVTDATHGAIEGDFVTISSVSGTANGITAGNLEGEFEIQSVTDTNNYVIIAKAAASGTGASGVTGTAEYQINTNPSFSIQGYGWGAGTW